MSAILRINIALAEYTQRARMNVIPDGVSVRDTLMALHIPSELVALALANGEAVDKDYIIQTNDLIEIHPIIGGG